MAFMDNKTLIEEVEKMRILVLADMSDNKSEMVEVNYYGAKVSNN